MLLSHLPSSACNGYHSRYSGIDTKHNMNEEKCFSSRFSTAIDRPDRIPTFQSDQRHHAKGQSIQPQRQYGEVCPAASQLSRQLQRSADGLAAVSGNGGQSHDARDAGYPGGEAVELTACGGA